MVSYKSDVDAKEAFSEYLSNKGFKNIKIVSKPSDIIAYKGKDKYYFEIKKTDRKERYFGGATTTEWKAALENPDRYFFVICVKRNNLWQFTQYTPEEFMKFSTIPPFKVYFSVPLSEKEKGKKINRISAIQATKDNLFKLINFYESLKKLKDK